MYGIPRAKPAHAPRAGAKIHGPGTGTSDSIKIAVPAGSYIMPADSTEQLGFGVPRAGASQVPVNVSNGETAIPPEQVHAVGVQTLDAMKNATHVPAAQQQGVKGFQPRSNEQGKPELFFADGGAVQEFSDSVGGYWSSDSAQFEAGSPSTMQRVGRALNPVTSLGSAIGAMYDAAGQGDVAGMGLAAAQAIPVFGAVRAVAPTLKTAAGFVPSAGKTAAATAGSAAFGVAADQYTPSEQSFADGGLVEDPEKKWTPEQRAQKQAQLAQQAEQLRLVRAGAPGGVPGNPARAAAMQAQYDQPVYGPRNKPAGGLPSPLKPAAKPTLAEGDLAQAAAELASKQQPTNGPSVRFGVPSRRAEPAGQAPLSAAEASKANQWAGGVSDRASGAAIAAVKTNPDGLPPTAAGGEGAPASKLVTPLQSQQTAPQAGRGAYLKTGIGQGAAGGEIVGRVGADGVPEFTNDAKAVAGAQAMPKGGFGYPSRATATPGNMTAPAGARVLASGTNVPAGDAELARTGSAANVGNGIGTFSVMGEAGDAQRAIAAFERANEIRAGVPRQRELGDNGGKLTVVRDSSRAPSTTELVNAKLEAGQAQTAALQARVAQGQQEQDRADLTAVTDRQLKAMESAQAGLALADRQRLSELQQAILDPSLSTEDRRLLADQYRVLSGNKAENRFTVVPGGQAINEQGVAYTLPSTVINNQTGEFVQQGDSGSGGGSSALPMPASAAEAKVGAVYETAKGPARWDGKQFIPVVS